MSSPAIPPHDRLPTFEEINSFDAELAWDRLTTAEQRRVGVLAVRLGTVGQITQYVPTKDWPRDQQNQVLNFEDQASFEFMQQCEPLWARLFGWIPAAVSTTKFLRMVS